MAHSHGGHSHAHSFDSDARMLEYRELESEVLPTYWQNVLEWVGAAAAEHAPQRILDLGAGTGIASLALAKRFSAAEVIALDVDAAALELIRGKAGKALVADRVVTLEADLDTTWPDLTELGLTWASMSLHHLADPDQVLRKLLANTHPGGLVAVAEGGVDLQVLPDELGVGRPGLERRCLDVQAEEHARTLPELGADWTARLRDAGFTIVAERTFELDESPPTLPATARFAELRLQRLRDSLADQLAADDRDTLDLLLDEGSPHYVGGRTDFVVRGSRNVSLATP